MDVTRLSPPPLFLRRKPGNEARLAPQYSTVVYFARVCEVVKCVGQSRILARIVVTNGA